MLDVLFAKYAKLSTLLCVRNTYLEELHAGTAPTTKTGDFSDVKVIDGNGKEIPWNEVSRFNDEEMKRLMKEVVNRIYTFNVLMENPELVSSIELWKSSAYKWDDPTMDKYLCSFMESAKIRKAAFADQSN